jgi:eukaryotic-like serine/threonine-protein kinase
MLDPQASRFWQAALLSGLMDADALNACWNAIPLGKKEAQEHIDRRLARQAVQSSAVTLWQAQQLLAGRTSGYKVDRYVLLDLIGQGGMGRVYLARDTRLNRRVALKILSPERMSNPRAIARFQREGRVGAQLQHENLVRIYDFGESLGRYYLVMEYIEGKTIGTLLSEQGPMPPSTAARLARQVALGLEHAHRKGLIHRDVNPYNILVTHDGTAKLADLGLAIDLADHDHVTRDGATVGTFDYVAPEQARYSHAADIRSDIYSLGCTLYHMLTGQVPFPVPSLPEKLFSHQTLEPAALEQLVGDLPDGLGDVVRRMMHKAPDDRYSTPLQVAQALEPFIGPHADAGDSDAVPSHERATTAGRQAAKVNSGGAAPAAGALTRGLAVTADGSLPTTVPDLMSTGAVATQSATPSPSPLSPVSDVFRSDAEVQIEVNLGPEPALTVRPPRPKARSFADQISRRADGLASAARQVRVQMWGSVALGVTVLASAVMLAFANPWDRSRRDLKTTRSPTAESTSPTMLPSGSEAGTTPAPNPAFVSDIVVKREGEEDKPFSASKLLDAIQASVAKDAWIELRNSLPLRVPGDQVVDLGAAQGGLRIKAAPGTRPIIEVEIKTPKPFLTAGPQVPLELEGITIVARYSQPALISPNTAAPPPLIMAAGRCRIERSAIRLVHGPRAAGSRALLSNGGVLEVARSYFQGFDTAIDFAAMGRATAHVSETIFAPSTEPAAAQSSEWYSWALRLQVGASLAADPKRTQPHISLDHCTIDGAGVADLTSNLSSAGLRMQFTHCAIRAEAVLACRPGKDPKLQVHWSGSGNQYDILGRPWIVLSAKEGTPLMSTAPTDLAGWLEFVVHETNPVHAKLKFRLDPAMRSAATDPSVFTVEATANSGATPGADPSLVGPSSSR